MCALCERDEGEDEGGAASSRGTHLRYKHRPMACQHSEKSKPKSRNYQGPFRKTPGRLLGLFFIRLYQLSFSSLIGNQCRHLPSCSEYGYEAIARHGLWAGFWLTLFRVARCGPGGTFGVDDVPKTLDDIPRWAVWRFASLGRKRS